MNLLVIIRFVTLNLLNLVFKTTIRFGSKGMVMGGVNLHTKTITLETII